MPATCNRNLKFGTFDIWFLDRQTYRQTDTLIALWLSICSALEKHLLAYLLCTPTRGKLTSQPKVIWEQGHVAAQSLHWLQWRVPNSPPKLPLPADQFPNSTTCFIPKWIPSNTWFIRPTGVSPKPTHLKFSRFRTVSFLPRVPNTHYHVATASRMCC